MASIYTRSAAAALRVISTVLPEHTRRLILWSVLYSKICNDQCPKKDQPGFSIDQCSRLNRALALCKDEKALVLPAMLGKFIWSDLEGCWAETRKVIKGEKTEMAAAADFIKHIPSWLRYATDTLMARDFHSLTKSYSRAAV